MQIFKFIFAFIKMYINRIINTILLFFFIIALVILIEYNTGEIDPKSFSPELFLSYIEAGGLTLLLWYIIKNTPKFLFKILNKNITITNPENPEKKYHLSDIKVGEPTFYPAKIEIKDKKIIFHEPEVPEETDTTPVKISWGDSDKTK